MLIFHRITSRGDVLCLTSLIILFYIDNVHNLFILQLEKPIMAQGNVEIWLGKLLNTSLRSVHCVIRNAVTAINDPNFELLEFLNSYPAQVNRRGSEKCSWGREREGVQGDGRVCREMGGGVGRWEGKGGGAGRWEGYKRRKNRKSWGI